MLCCKLYCQKVLNWNSFPKRSAYVCRLRGPLPSEKGINKPVKARFWPGLEPFSRRKSLEQFKVFPLASTAASQHPLSFEILSSGPDFRGPSQHLLNFEFSRPDLSDHSHHPALHHSGYYSLPPPQGPPEGGGWGVEPPTPHLLTIHAEIPTPYLLTICGLPLPLVKGPPFGPVRHF